MPGDSERAVVYACVTAGYDTVVPVNPDWCCDFILFHDGTVTVPAGWQGRRLDVTGLSGADLNRYAKMLPHALALPSTRSMYVDGNVIFKRDPAPLIRTVLGEAAMSAYVHPARHCAYAEIREALRLGFIGPRAAWAGYRSLKRTGLPQRAGLFEVNVLFRRHREPGVVALGDAWWDLWQGGLRRDQPLLSAAIWRCAGQVHPIGHNDLRDGTNPYLAVGRHAKGRSRLSRLPNRLAAEAALFRTWLPR